MTDSNFDPFQEQSSHALGAMFGGDDPEESVSVDQVAPKFCRPDRRTPLSPGEGRVLWGNLRRNGYAPCSIKAGSKRPFGNAWQKRAFEVASAWTADAPGIGLGCGGLDQNGKPASLEGGLVVFDFDYRLKKSIGDYDQRASKAVSDGKTEQAARLRKIADHLRQIEPTLKEKEQALSRLLLKQPVLAKMRTATLERGRAQNPNFALLVRNDSTIDNAMPKLYLPVQVDGETVLIEAFGVDRLAAGKQLVGFHLHPDTCHPWLWENNRSPESVPLGELPQIDIKRWDELWSEIVAAGATLGFVEGGVGRENRNCKETRESRALGSDGLKGEVPTHILACALEPNIAASKADLAPPLPDTMRAMLERLVARDYFEDRQGVINDADGRIAKLAWIETGMALRLAYGDDVGFELWAITHIDDQARNDAAVQWASFAAEARPGDVRIGTLIKAATDAGFPRAAVHVAEIGYVSYGPFTMDGDNGLTKKIETKSGKIVVVAPAWVSAPFEILGACRDPHGRAWGKQIRFRDADNRVHMRHVSDAALQSDPATLCAALADDGLKINRSRQRELAEFLNGVRVNGRVTVVNRTGWHEIAGRRAFVLPAETIAADIAETVALDTMAHGPYEARGSLEDWKQGVGRLTAGHALPVFMVSAGLAGPLAHFVGAEGGGIHVFGPSSIGKSAMLCAAASVWGRGGTPGYVRSWRATANGLEGAAASATDTCLVLDELGVGEAREVAPSIYVLANGSGKARAARDGALREPKSWRVFVLSSGELPVETKLGEDRWRKTRAGQLVRLLDIPADRGLGFGAFDHAGDYSDAGKLADAIKDAAGTAYGTAGPQFVRHLIAFGVEKIIVSAQKFMAGFVRSVVKPGASEQIFRAAKKFALIALAGELATVFGVTSWKKGDARQAVIWAFDRWVEKRGGTGSHEERQAIEQVRLIIEKHGDSRFEPADGFGGEVRDRLGWRKGQGTDREWYVPSEAWKAEFCDGLDPTFAARTLAARGMLRRQDEKHLQCVVALGGKQRIRAYVLTAAILDSGDGEP
jgi:uncharacterized protein (DUF927 family)